MRTKMMITLTAVVLLAAGALIVHAEGTGGDAPAAVDAAPAEISQAAADSAAAAREMEVAKLMVQRCAQCHGEGRPAAGLSLERVDFPGSMVGVPSTQIDTLLLVEPGRPERSYLVWKLRGFDDITGSRMPMGPKPLPEGQIQLVDDWIEKLPEPAPQDTTEVRTE
ncbi:MAG: hypothetical protein GF405_01695 [Candidatus Eisenbacteria bacterium]|nr:hypothetical protein [Candidatus Eisenbacteria bacterium]